MPAAALFQLALGQRRSRLLLRYSAELQSTPASSSMLPPARRKSRRNRLLEGTENDPHNTNSLSGHSSPIYTAEIIPTTDPRADRFRAQFDRRTKAMVYAVTLIDVLFPDTENCDVAAELWSLGSVELPGYKVCIQARLCNCLPGVACSFCQWRERASRVRSRRTSLPSRGVLVSIRDGRDTPQRKK